MSKPGGEDRAVEQAREDLRLSKEAAKAVALIRVLGTKLRSYDSEHQLVVEAADQTHRQLVRTLDSLVEPELSLQVTDHGFECHGVLLQSEDKMVGNLYERCRRRGIGRVVVLRGVGPQETLDFVKLLYRDQKGHYSLDLLREQLHGVHVRNILVEAGAAAESSPTALAGRRASGTSQRRGKGESAGKAGARIAEPRALYLSLIELVKELRTQARLGAGLDTQNLPALANDLARIVLSKPLAMLPFAQLRLLDRFEFTHPVNTAILALIASAEVITGVHELTELAKSALLLGVEGCVEDRDLPALEEDLRPEPAHAPPLNTAIFFDRTPALSKLSMVLAFEHRLRNDFAGAPQQPFRWKQNFFTALLATADRFGRLTTAGSDGEQGPATGALCPIDALNQMMQEVGGAFPLFAFGAFIRTVGPFPPGSVIELTDGRLAVVLYREDPAWAAAFTDPRGRLVDRPEHVGVRFRSDNIAAKQTVSRPIDANLLPFSMIDYLNVGVFPGEPGDVGAPEGEEDDTTPQEEQASHG